MQYNPKEEYKNYNTFRVFENVYGKKQDENPEEFEIPEYGSQNSRFKIIKFLACFVFLGIVGLVINPVLSYVLKTPYPVIAITDNSMFPVLKKNDLILMRGLIKFDDLKNGDIVVYTDGNDKKMNFIVKIVSKIDKDKLVVKGFNVDSAEDTIYQSQIVGISAQKNGIIKLPKIGKFAMAKK